MQIDLNCDMGESFGAYRIGDDEAILPLVSSANIACGFHAGDPLVMARTVRLARDHGVAIGAHPGYPDLMGFGRRLLQTAPGEIRHYVLYQLGALFAFVRSQKARLQHLKIHGALYNFAARDEAAASEVIGAVKDFDPELILVTLAGSRFAALAEDAGLRVAREAFPDRGYTADGQLAPRSLPGAVIHDAAAVRDRIVRLLSEGVLTAVDGTEIPLGADTLCIHGDTPGAAVIARTLRESLEEAGVRIVPMADLV